MCHGGEVHTVGAWRGTHMLVKGMGEPHFLEGGSEGTLIFFPVT